MADPYVGEIRLTGFNYAPPGWALCYGQTLAISQNQALFAVLGTQYGGNGVSTFQLPNMQSRVPMGQGQGPGLSPRPIGQVAGSETVTLLTSQMPAHIHGGTVYVTSEDATLKSPVNATLASTQNAIYGPTTNENGPSLITNVAGSGLPHDNVQPFLVVSFMIALNGIFPSRN